MVKFSHKISLSFFTRLYISIFLAIILSFLLTQYVVEDMMEQDAIHDFVRDTGHIYAEVNRQILEDKVKYPQKHVFNLPFMENFKVRWLPLDNDESVCQQCDYLGTVSGVAVFALENDGQLLAVHSLAEFSMQLIIEDEVHADSAATDYDNDEEIENLIGLNVEEAVFILFVIILLLIISLTIYWPVRQLQKQINGLVSSTQSFGAGKLDVRADELLEKPLNILAHSFNTMATSIADTVKENQIFAQAVPHEMRTPLSRIQLAAGLLRKDSTNEKELTLLDNIDTYIDDIDELISQVVAFSKLNAISEQDESDYYQSIELNAFVSSRIAALAPKKELDIVLDIEPSAEITTNPVYLRLLLDNLIKNAVSHSKQLIRISVTENHNNTVLTVEDDGPGIAKEFHDTIFFPFARIDKSRSRKTGGLGLGLAIAKSVTKRMFGELSVDKSALGGAAFVVEFIRH